MIAFKKIDATNLAQAVQLDAGVDEKLLPPVVYQIATSYVYPSKIPFLVYDDAQLIGFVSYERDLEPEPAYDILVLMIDRPFQGRGLGEKALRAFIEYLSGLQDCNLITLNVHRDNTRARNLYRKVGFRETDRQNPLNGEIVLEYRVGS